MDERRRLSRRDFLRMAAATAAGAIVAACAPAPPEVVEVEKVVKETVVVEKEVTVEKVVTATPKPAEVVTIQYWFGWGEATVKAVQAIAEKFTEKNPYIKAEIAGSSGDERILTAIAGGTPPELGSNLNYLGLIARGVCIPQTEWINASKVVDKEDFPKEAWTLFIWEGEIYGIPGVESAPRESLGYNIGLVQEAGLDLNNPPQTWDEVFEWHKALTQFDAAGNAVVVGLDPMDAMGGSIGYGDPWMWPPSWGFDYFDEQTFEFDIDRPETAEIFSTIKMFYDYVGVEKMEAFRKGYGTWTASPTAGFPAGAQAMIITGGWSPGWLSVSARDRHFAYTWMPVSTPRKGKKVQIWGGHAPIMFQGSKHPEEAFRFAEYLTCDDEAANILWESIGFQPARYSWWAKVDVTKYEGFEFFAKSIVEADEMWPSQPNPITGVTSDEWTKARDGVNYGDITPEQAARDMQAALTKALQEMLEER